ncbi:MAG: CcmD family protein [Actinobacteria bacterium]|nr:CcmD family protein [Actinomycetota bacterium]
MSDLVWLFVAFLAVWAGIGGYLLTIGSRQRRLERRLADLDSRTGPPSS